MIPKTEQFVVGLIDTEDPIGLVWQALSDLWRVERVPNNIDDFFYERERATNDLERVAWECFFELYELLARRALEAEIKPIPEDNDGMLIFMDGLSVREASLLLPALGEAGFKWDDVGYSLSAIPSNTEPFVQRAFGTSSPSAIRGGDHFSFQHIPGGRFNGYLPLRGKLLVWITFPDELMHHAGRIVTPSEAFAKTRDALLGVLENCGRAEATITSDHGYIYAQRAIEHCWSAPREDERLLRGIFGSRRAVPVSEVSGRDRKRLERPPDRQYAVQQGEHYCVVGRYYWSAAGHSSDVAHGGVSFTECLVPVLRVRKAE